MSKKKDFLQLIIARGSGSVLRNGMEASRFAGQIRKSNRLDAYTQWAHYTTDNSSYEYISGMRVRKFDPVYLKEANRHAKENIFESVDEIWKLTSSDNTPIPPCADIRTDLVGKLLKIEGKEGERSLEPLTPEEIPNVDVIGIWGLDTADDPRGIVSSSQVFSNLLFPDSLEASRRKQIAVFYPSESRDQRYKHGLHVFLDVNYPSGWGRKSEWVKAFVGENILPRLIDRNGQLLPAEKVKPLLLLGYSLGGREITMIENMTIDFLSSEFGKEKETLLPYMNKFLRFNVACAVNWGAPKNEEGFLGITVVAVNDMGFKRQKSFMNGAFADGAWCAQDVSIKHRLAVDRGAPRDFLVILKEVPAFVMKRERMQLNRLGHGLAHYGEELKEKGQELVAIVHNFLEGKPVEELRLPRDTCVFQPNLRMSNEIWHRINLAWEQQLHKQDRIQAEHDTAHEQKTVISPNICNNSGEWSKYFVERKTKESSSSHEK